MAIIVDSITPSPVVIPHGGEVSVLVQAHASPGDAPGSFELRFIPVGGGTPQVLASVPGVIDNPDDPVPWLAIELVPLELPGVMTENLGGGTYRVTHAP